MPLDTRIAVTADGRYEADSHRLEYEGFVLRVLNMMRLYKYEVIRDYTHDSHANGFESMHFAFRQDKEILGKNIRFIVFIRISEHPLYLGSTNIQNKEIYDDMKNNEFGLEYGDLLIDPIKVDARDQDSEYKALNELITNVKSFPSEATVRATELIRTSNCVSESMRPLVNPTIEDAATYQFDRDVVFSDPEYGERWIDEVLKNDSGD